MVWFLISLEICWIIVVIWSTWSSNWDELYLFNYAGDRPYVTMDFATFQKLYYNNIDAWIVMRGGIYYKEPRTIVRLKDYKDLKQYKRWYKKEVKRLRQEVEKANQEKEFKRLEEIMHECGGDEP